MSGEVRLLRLKWSAAGWRSLVTDPGITGDVDARARAIAAQAEAASSDTAVIRVDAGLVRTRRRYRAAVIASDVPPRRDAAYQALLASLDAGR